MKLKDIKTGTVYAKRSYGTSRWGVPVTTQKLYEFPKYRPDTSLYSGNGVLVLTWRAPIGNGRYGTEEDALKAAAKITDAPGYGSISELSEKLRKKGLGLEIWTPREFEGTVEDVKAAKAKEDEYNRAVAREQSQTTETLKQQFERIQNDLGIKSNAYFLMRENKVSMNPRDWKEMMDRVEALIQTSGPLSSGSL